MERDLNFKKLIKMLVLNVWLMILGGCICAAGLIFFSSVSQNYTMVKKVYLVYDMKKPEDENLTVRKNNYFDAYQNLYRSNFTWTSDEFTEEEKDRIGDISVEVSSCMYTITVILPDGENLEDDKAIFDELVEESEIWMKEKFNDDSLFVEVLSDETVVSQNGTRSIVKAVLGFVVGAVLVAILLFVIFILDRKIRTVDDVNYYLEKECLSVVEKDRGISDLREYVLLSGAKVWGITGISKHLSKTKIAQDLFEKLRAVGKNVLYLAIEQCDEKANMVGAVDLNDALEKDLSNVQKIYLSDWSQVEQVVYSNEFENKLQVLGNQYDCVIVDVVALDENSISKKVCSMCDENLLVVADGEINGEYAANCVQQLSKLNVELAGIVLSKLDIRKRIVRF